MATLLIATSISLPATPELSITTARKGRRSKSRDLSKDEPSSSTASTGLATSANVHNNDVSIDITLNVQNGIMSTTTTPASNNNELISNRPPMRRISGGWADNGLKSLRSKKNSFDDERFQQTRPTTSSIPTDDIPIIPDLEDVKDEILYNEVAEPPTISSNRVVTLKELNSDLLSQNAFSAIEDVDLSILTRCLQSQENLEERDEVWEWEKLFTEVTAEINSDKSANAGVLQKIEIGPDEVPPTSKNK
ncbi:intraflagellar transport protein 43 homolog [Scaptodrosophila lebanonensis]|uniref:Intraflagellar transport protein 43 homolog n=1 Tax=Drosophila lebanonensis TaxID=7225 RepID=A0A6J2U9V2_DROLE|nr:intraflagellar transport protein 43 homolog [Scaptodrosophila lebanonensis]